MEEQYLLSIILLFRISAFMSIVISNLEQLREQYLFDYPYII